VSCVGADYQQLRAAWAKTARDAGNLEIWNRSLVYNYLASAAEYASRVLNNQGNDPAAAEDARRFAADIRLQDPVRHGYGLANKALEIFGFGTVGGLYWVQSSA